MRPGNGRHRRPRQVPAIVVAAGVTGSALAMPLLAATGANAADAQTWDKVAQCESGGTWSTNSGNGAYGGLQMTQELWEQYGGRAYAPRPDLASRAQQIAVADQILNAGAGTWEACGSTAGLAKDGKAPDVNPGSNKDLSHVTPAPRAPEHEPSADTPTGSGTPSSEAPSASPSSSPSASPSSTPAPSSSPSAHPGTGSTDGGTSPGGKHRKDPSTAPTGDPTQIPTAPVPSTGGPGDRPTDSASTPSQTPGGSNAGSDKGGETGSAGGGGKHRAGSPRSDEDGHASRGDSDARAEKPAAGDYTVRPGDNLSDIAEAHSVNGGWHSLYQSNEKAVGSDPDLILPGQRLEVGK
ncbi:transglycosylase [Streptomyces griseocarneus]|nr:transglycosylase [Streptomyces griseocarneus]